MDTRADNLVLLAKIAEAGSFSEASRISGIPKSRLSRRLADLEEQLGVRLIERTPRSFRVTELGLKLSRHGAAIQAERDAAMDLARDALGAPAGSLSVACPLLLAEMTIANVAARFVLEHPRVRLTFDTISGLTPSELSHYDLAFRAATDDLPDADMVARPLAVTPYEVVASPGWISQAGDLQEPADLSGLDGIGWWQIGATPRWRLVPGVGAPIDILITPRLQTNNLFVAREAALTGVGMARLPAPMCAHAIATGRLRRVLPNVMAAPVSIYSVYPTRRSLTPAGRTFLEMVEADLTSHRGKMFIWGLGWGADTSTDKGP